MAMKAPKGTRDMLPQDAYRWQYIEEEWAKICSEYGFREIRTPVFESTDLFNRGVGDTTDIVQKEMYTFEDMGGRSITLKPEGTSPAVRAFIESNLYAETQPTKIFYDTPCYRYEKPQAGRLREFHQFGIENFGTPSMMADAEIIALGYDFLQRMGIEDIELHISSVGCRKCRPVYRKVLQDFLRPKYDCLCETCKSRFDKNPMRILDCKSPEDKEAVKDAPMMIDYMCEDCRKDFEELKSYLDAMGIDYVVDPSIVRGLDYYTKTAFEFITTKIGAQGTVCGGGRYDSLVKNLGGEDTPAIGFAMGMERLASLIGERAEEKLTAYIVSNNTAEAVKLTQELRSKGIACEFDLTNKKFVKQLEKASKTAKFAVILGEDEIANGEVTVKNLDSGEQKTVKRDELKLD